MQTWQLLPAVPMGNFVSEAQELGGWGGGGEKKGVKL